MQLHGKTLGIIGMGAIGEPALSPASYCVVYMLCAVCCVLCAACCVLCAMCCVLCAACCVLCAVCCVLYAGIDVQLLT